MANVTLLRHGQAARHLSGIDLIRDLSEEGVKKNQGLEIPHFTNVIVSPAQRTLRTLEIVLRKRNDRERDFTQTKIDVEPLLYAPILLPEMDAMYHEYGDNVTPYINDPRITSTRELVAEMIEKHRPILTKKHTLVVAHGLILNLIAFELTGDSEAFKYNLDPGTFFTINEGQLLPF